MGQSDGLAQMLSLALLWLIEDMLYTPPPDQPMPQQPPHVTLDSKALLSDVGRPTVHSIRCGAAPDKAVPEKLYQYWSKMFSTSTSLKC